MTFPKGTLYKDIVAAGVDPDRALMSVDLINHPPHYQHACGVECITITEHLRFNPGNAVACVFRNRFKGEPLQDLEKAEFYLKRVLRFGKLAVDMNLWAKDNPPGNVMIAVEKIWKAECEDLFDTHPRAVFWSALIDRSPRSMLTAVQNLITLERNK